MTDLLDAKATAAADPERQKQLSQFADVYRRLARGAASTDNNRSTRLTPGQHMQLAALMHTKSQQTSTPENRKKFAELAVAYRKIAKLRAGKPNRPSRSRRSPTTRPISVPCPSSRLARLISQMGIMLRRCGAAMDIGGWLRRLGLRGANGRDRGCSYLTAKAEAGTSRRRRDGYVPAHERRPVYYLSRPTDADKPAPQEPPQQREIAPFSEQP